ncbi:kinase-like domain-containing protein [Chytridium lagenaria]|nr:kinase-like domain-containing protein [Chytridium lagenaria]
MSLALELGLPERSCETVRSSVELSGEESELVRASDVTLPAASNGPPSKNYATEDNRIVSLSSFTLLEHIGSGSWGRVLCVKQNEANSFHAMKVIDKTKLGPSNVMMVRQELKTLAELGLHPNLLRLDYAFQTYTHLFLVTELCHSDLLTYLEHQDYLDDNDVRTCASSVASAIDFLHNQNILHCDIKADNIMINLDQHKRIRMYKLGDFGVCREGNYFTGPCGTFTSMAPEVMQDINGYGLYVDWWSYGILLYHISVGCFPFSGETPRAVFDCIRATESKIRFPKRLSVIFMDLVTKLLILEPKERLGFNGAEEIQAHPFFQGVDWSEDTPPFEVK